ncbi:MAG TPA: class I SAM-dependent methyltransferase [Thermoanaerobaculia bacterium]|nr:class I SAM-dependent methyltransferase [Thermoanaerobaculia bacterium]
MTAAPLPWNLVSTRTTQFPYFDELLGRPDWRHKKVLDFGGNIGTFLVGAEGRVAAEDYWCIDINREVVEQGRREWPRANFLHFDRYSPQYNARGTRNLPIPDPGIRFDFILAFSVFTHTDRGEMIELVGGLRRMLAPGGVLAFTFCDPRWDRSLSDPSLPPGSDVRKMLERHGDMKTPAEREAIVERAMRSDWCVLIDTDLYTDPGDELSNQVRTGNPLESYCSYFAAEYLASLFPDAEVHPPVSPEWQHCCVFREQRAASSEQEPEGQARQVSPDRRSPIADRRVEGVMEEVHRWRGSAEQRASRPVSMKSGQFAYFDRQLGHPDWRGRKVLDFGGNEGGLLLDPRCAIDPASYYCLDVVPEALEEGRRRFPRAHWVHYDRYNCSFNPGGNPHQPVPDLGVAFDMIVAYSVFTHTTRADMHDLVAQLRSKLAPGGVLAFTFIDPHLNPLPDAWDVGALEWRLGRFRANGTPTDVEGILRRGEGADWCALVDGTDFYVNGDGDGPPCMSYHVYYTVEQMARELPGAELRAPVNGEMQHCCILRRAR